MSEARTSETDIALKSLRGNQEVEFCVDPDGDLYIQISQRRGTPESIYVSAASALKLRDWLNKVIS